MACTLTSSSTLLAAALALMLAAGTATASEDPPAETDHRLDWWREARFGLFIHWGLYAIPAGEWGDRQNHGEWIRHTAQIPIETYDQLLKRFNPIRFDADQWARIARDAGMKYIVITSKHHDGFCLFDSALTEYDVMSTPFQRDIMKELADACRRHGLKICWYHSIMDWHHPDYLPRRGWESRPADGADLDRYVRYMHGQVTELLTGYGDIGVMWFDGEWEGTWTHDHGQALYDLCRSLQDDVIVNNRVDKGRAGMAGMTTDRKFLGDFGTPEQEIPATGVPGVDWETCMTMNRHWGFNRYDDSWKSSEQLIRMLVDIASKGGNFLLNVGPTAAGEFPDPSIERLADMGAWMRVNGEAIHGTTASPFTALPWGRCTVNQDDQATTLFLHVFDWPADGTLLVPGLGNETARAFLLSEPAGDLAVTRDESDVRIAVGPSAPDPVCTVVALEIAGEPVVYETPRIVAVSEILVRPIRVELATRSPELAIRYTLDGTRPSAASALYEGPLVLADTTTVAARAFHHDRPVSGETSRTFTRVEPASATNVEHLVAGLRCEVYDGSWDTLPDFDALTPDAVEMVPAIAVASGPAREHVGRRFTGYIKVPRDDVYVFALDSDDGSRLTIGGTVVVDNDGLHGTHEERGVIALAAGSHPITVEWFNKTGGAELMLRYGAVGGALQPVASSELGRSR